MLKRGAEKEALFSEIDELVSSLSLLTVEVFRTDSRSGTKMYVTLTKKEGEITLDELESAYNLIYPRYSVLLGERDLELEVSSPGLERAFRDCHEFSVFLGRRVRLYSVQHSSYISGIILKSDERSVTLGDYRVEDTSSSGEEISVMYDDIAKAKLDYKWEDKNDKSDS